MIFRTRFNLCARILVMTPHTELESVWLYNGHKNVARQPTHKESKNICSCRFSTQVPHKWLCFLSTGVVPMAVDIQKKKKGSWHCGGASNKHIRIRGARSVRFDCVQGCAGRIFVGFMCRRALYITDGTVECFIIHIVLKVMDLFIAFFFYCRDICWRKRSRHLSSFLSPFLWEYILKETIINLHYWKGSRIEVTDFHLSFFCSSIYRFTQI